MLKSSVLGSLAFVPFVLVGCGSDSSPGDAGAGRVEHIQAARTWEEASTSAAVRAAMRARPPARLETIRVQATEWAARTIWRARQAKPQLRAAQERARVVPLLATEGLAAVRARRAAPLERARDTLELRAHRAPVELQVAAEQRAAAAQLAAAAAAAEPRAAAAEPQAAAAAQLAGTLAPAGARRALPALNVRAHKFALPIFALLVTAWRFPRETPYISSIPLTGVTPTGRAAASPEARWRTPALSRQSLARCK